MGFVSDLFNSSKGAGFNAGAANIQDPATTAQANEQYSNVQNGLGQQNAFVQALQAQNGIGNQSQVYSQLQGVANGTGPNPAQAMLNQQTANNVAQTSAMQAGQRGANQNVGLIARQAGNMGMNAQQQAVGQGATMQANQSLNAINAAGQMANQQVSNQANATNAYSQAAQGAQSNILNAIGAQNNANVGMQSNQNTTNAGIAAGNQKFQTQVFGGLAQGAAVAMNQGGTVPGRQNLAYGGVSDSNAAAGNGPKSGVGQFFNNMNSDNGVQKAAGGISGMITGGIRSGINSLFGSSPQAPAAPIAGSSMSDYQNLNSFGNNAQDYNNITDIGQQQSDGLTAMDPVAASPGADSGIMDAVSSAGPAAMAMSRGGQVPQGKQVPVMLSPGEKVLDPREAANVVQGKESIKAAGKVVPGQAKVAGDSLKNDIVPTTAEEDSVVIPRSHMKDMSSALKFVHAHMNREKALALGKK